MPPRSKKAYKGLPLEGWIARWYARLAERYVGEYRQLAEAVAGRMAGVVDVLEVGPGAGFLAIELARLGPYRIVGLDISKSLVRIASANAARLGARVTFVQGNAACMPFEPAAFDFIVCRAAFKNFAEPIQALHEIYRVLRPGGEAFIFDLRREASVEAIDAHVANLGLGRFNSLLMKWMFKYVLVRRAYSLDQFRLMTAQTPFQTCAIRHDMLRLEVSLRKDAPVDMASGDLLAPAASTHVPFDASTAIAPSTSLNTTGSISPSGIARSRRFQPPAAPTGMK
jgi:ubiquinone/menaquinone biosynthesis C-methylase UbiE